MVTIVEANNGQLAVKSTGDRNTLTINTVHFQNCSQWGSYFDTFFWNMKYWALSEPGYRARWTFNCLLLWFLSSSMGWIRILWINECTQSFLVSE